MATGFDLPLMFESIPCLPPWRTARPTARGQICSAFGQIRRLDGIVTSIVEIYFLTRGNTSRNTPMYQLYYYPANANAAPHMLLEELGVDYELVLVDRTDKLLRSPKNT